VALLPSFQSQIVRMIIPSLPEAELKTLCQSSFHRAAHSSERAKPLDFGFSSGFVSLAKLGEMTHDFLPALCNTATILLTLITVPLVVTASTTPAPIVISPSQYWEGNDGLWSTFTLQIGTPAQDGRVLISTAGNQAWAILPQGCANSYLSNCVDSRGGSFNPNASSSWIMNNYYDLHLESNLGIVDTGEFGFERLGIGWQGSNSPTLEHQIVAGISTNDFWLGTFGLNPRPTNFSGFTDPQTSFMQSLKNKSMIPSLSWSYTAGAAYRNMPTHFKMETLLMCSGRIR